MFRVGVDVRQCKRRFAAVTPMEMLGLKNKATQASIRQIAFASSIGTAIEYYDFFLYGTAAATVFPRLFFPKFSPVGGTLASFATFGVAYFARPVGGGCLRAFR